MASLLDKLRRAAAAPPKPARPAPDSCYKTVERFPLFDAARMLSSDTVRLIQGLEGAPDAEHEDILYFDTETTGLSGGAGTLAFLVGTGRIEGNDFVVRQYFMRDYDEEAFVLEAFAEQLKTAKIIVTFNGASFDIPLLKSRMVMHRMGERTFPAHVDLLHAAKRVFKMRLGRCTLQTLEEKLLAVRRENDLPGALVPERFFEYLKTGNLAVIEPILVHNVQDVHSMHALLNLLVRLHENPLSAEHREDLFSLGRVFEKRSEGEKAGMCYRMVDGRLAGDAKMRLADMRLKNRQIDEATLLYEQLRLAGAPNAKVYITLSKIYEHRFKRYDRALAIARQGMLYCLERSDMKAAKNDRDYQDLAYRHARLLKKNGGNQSWDF